MIQNNLKFNKVRDLYPVDELPRFEVNIEAMLANGTVPDISSVNFNEFDMDEVGDRPEDLIDASLRSRHIITNPALAPAENAE